MAWEGWGGPGCPHLQAPDPAYSDSPGLSLSGLWWLVPTSLQVSLGPLFLVALQGKISHRRNTCVKSRTFTEQSLKRPVWALPQANEMRVSGDECGSSILKTPVAHS